MNIEEKFLTAYRLSEGHTLNGRNADVREMRSRAIEAFRTQGFPARKTEAYKYTDLTELISGDFEVDVSVGAPPVDPETVETFAMRDEGVLVDCIRVVLVNGRFDAALSRVDRLPDGVVVGSLAAAADGGHPAFTQAFGRCARPEEDAFCALSTAFFRDGAFIHVPDDTRLSRPVHVISLGAGEQPLFIQPRLLAVFGARADGDIVLSHHALPGCRHRISPVCELQAAVGARARFLQLQDLPEGCATLTHTHVVQDTESVVSTSTFTVGGRLVRNNLRFLPDAEHCESNLAGLFLGRDRDHIDNHTLVDHARPNCLSNELYKGVLAGRATGVFNGKVIVRRDAQKTNAYQSNKSIVLDDTARMFAKPELEIYADDVKCSHGATTGALDPEGVFYLRTRGLSEEAARRMMLGAFASDVLDTVGNEDIRAWVADVVAARLAAV